MGVGQAAALAVVVFAVLFWLANRFNDSEIRRVALKDARALLEITFGPRTRRRGVDVVRVDGVEVEVDLAYRLAPPRGVIGTARASVVDGRIAPIAPDVHGTARTRVRSDGASVTVAIEHPDAISEGVRIAGALASEPVRALGRLSSAWTGTGARRTREVAEQRVQVTIDAGFRVALDHAPAAALRDRDVPVADALVLLTDHPRSVELRELAGELAGRIVADASSVALTLPISATQDEVDRAALFLARLVPPRIESAFR